MKTKSKPQMVYDYLRGIIEENKFNLNVKLPSENELAMKFKVARQFLSF